MRNLRSWSAVICLLAVGCGALEQPEAVAPAASPTWEEFLSVTYQDENGIYVANGDEPFGTLEELQAFYWERIAARPAGSSKARQELAVYSINGVDVKWNDSAKLNLTYCVSTRFAAQYNQVVSSMNEAAAEWEATAKVNFIHLPIEDGSCSKNNPNVVFDVNPTRGGRYLARAFFPNYPRKSRNILIDGTSFSTSAPLTLTGILRHELGHTLGFRHEHTRPEAGVCFEDNQWRALTAYDSGSVMHYPQCNGTGDWSLTLTTKDKDGARSLYP